MEDKTEIGMTRDSEKLSGNTGHWNETQTTLNSNGIAEKGNDK